MLVGDTQATTIKKGHGFLLMANSSGDWIDYRELSESERWGYSPPVRLAKLIMVAMTSTITLNFENDI